MVWRMLLHGFAMQMIQEKLAERTSEAGRAAEVDDVPCDVGFVFALGIESGGLEDLLENPVEQTGNGFRLREGWLDGRRVAVVIGGAGRPAAAHAAQALIAGRRPKWIVSAGFGGGLDPRAEKFDVVLCNEIDAAGESKRYSVDFKVTPEALAATKHVHVGRLLTVDQIVYAAAEKQALGQSAGALVVDMETHSVAEVCREAATKFMAVRIVTDTANDDLPPDVGRLLDQKTMVRQA
ncbi:MAG TPA: hypothetical protein VGE52_14500, partial [Pirellulales bacterium]